MDAAAAVQVWIPGSLLLCGLIYTYYIALRLPKGFLRFLAISIVLGMLVYFPWQIQCLHLRIICSFLFAWLGVFKLLMLCFDEGPLTNHWAMQSPRHFISVAVLPVKIHDLSFAPKFEVAQKSLASKAKVLFLELCILSVVIYSYSFRELIPHSILMVLYCFHLYLSLDIVMECLRAPVNALFSVDPEPLFNKPYLSSSLQDFWGRRWNSIVSCFLRESVYSPALRLLWGIHKTCRQKKENSEHGRQKFTVWTRAVAIMLTFLVSGLMHELIIFYVSRRRPTWEQTSFFALHGLCVVAETALKRKFAHISLPKFVCVPLTLGFVYTTALWLFFPPITRDGLDIVVIAEYHEMVKFLFPAK